MTLAIHEDHAIERQVHRPSLAISNAGGAVVKSFDDLARLAAMISKSGLAPNNMQTPEKIGVAILWGMEIGLSPMQAIQSIAIINNRPCLWGDALPALVESSPLCEYVDERLEGDGDAMVAICESKRRNSPRAKTTRFSVADAKKAGLWSKSGPWAQYPKRMLQVRARAFNFRDNFADVLRGIGVAEEQQDIEVTTMPAAPVVPTSPASSELDDFAEIAVYEQPAQAAAAQTLPPPVEDQPAPTDAPPEDEIRRIKANEALSVMDAGAIMAYVTNLPADIRTEAKAIANLTQIKNPAQYRAVAFNAHILMQSRNRE